MVVQTLEWEIQLNQAFMPKTSTTIMNQSLETREPSLSFEISAHLLKSVKINDLMSFQLHEITMSKLKIKKHCQILGTKRILPKLTGRIDFQSKTKQEIQARLKILNEYSLTKSIIKV